MISNFTITENWIIAIGTKLLLVIYLAHRTQKLYKSAAQLIHYSPIMIKPM